MRTTFAPARREGTGLLNAEVLNRTLLGAELAGHTESRIAFAGIDYTWTLRVPVRSRFIYAAAGHRVDLLTPEGMLVTYKPKRKP